MNLKLEITPLLLGNNRNILVNKVTFLIIENDICYRTLPYAMYCVSPLSVLAHICKHVLSATEIVVHLTEFQ